MESESHFDATFSEGDSNPSYIQSRHIYHRVPHLWKTSGKTSSNPDSRPVKIERGKSEREYLRINGDARHAPCFFNIFL